MSKFLFGQCELGAVDIRAVKGKDVQVRICPGQIKRAVQTVTVLLAETPVQLTFSHCKSSAAASKRCCCIQNYVACGGNNRIAAKIRAAENIDAAADNEIGARR